ncbi:pentapeptide repeat-containing protein [Nocardioides sp. NBC_00163]|uniref:hypothetical protein n=1 Tax=Nocardioides sp. NBC_00163 TaxID=2975999 RepID=UPI00324D23E2
MEREKKMHDGDRTTRKWQSAKPFLLSIPVHIGLWLGIGLTLTACILLGLWVMFGKPDFQNQSTTGVGPEMLFNASKLALGVVAGMGGVVALVVATRRQRLGEADHGRQERATVRDETRLFAERFAQATQQLGSDQAAVRVAGVYALAGLADDWSTGRQTCVDVLCAYLRMPFRLREASSGSRNLEVLQEATEDPASGRMAYPAGEEHEVRSTILSAMQQRMNQHSVIRWTGLNLDFKGAIFDEAEFEGFIFEGCDVEFDDCVFLGATFFERCSVLMTRISFRRCIYLGSVAFTSCRFTDANVDLFGKFDSLSAVLSLDGSVFESGTIQLMGPHGNLRNVEFTDTVLAGGRIRIHGSNMTTGTGVSFNRSTIAGADISFESGTYDNGVISFNDVIFSAGEVTFQGHRIDRDAAVQGLAGTEFSFDDVDLSGGGIGFGFFNIEGSQIHFDRLSMTGGVIQFVDVTLKAGEVKLDAPNIAGGEIDLGDIGESESGRIIAAAAGEFLRKSSANGRFSLG